MIKVCIFDLDGTLADTVESLAYCGNRALEAMGLSAFPTDRYRYFAGDGSAELVRRCLRENGDLECQRFDELSSLYGAYFAKDCMYHVKPFPGITELLKWLKDNQIKISVFSNKPHEQAIDVVESLFGKGYFDYIQGQQEGIPRKPAPDGALKIASYFQVPCDECLYIGDTNTDMQTGNAAGMNTVGVLWGFRDREELEENHAKRIVNTPLEISAMLEKEFLKPVQDTRRSK